MVAVVVVRWLGGLLMVHEGRGRSGQHKEEQEAEAEAAC